ncbi:hypothetical protein ELH67_08195 [Rhizobium ruizarguesonis]|nr:hypothetical protein [Rhizobium ruizarguesonis]TAZ94538.1 hypothetical protein ELH67_08195 [Rhizobium ruizarguesonis]TBA37434.1 hypothetical protein ELH60_08230 [Rhizobium ruizarguesonis]TBC62780.1 hypothetical protein ELH36_08240 [Rhizobium ruizarguesonis]
MAIRCPRASRSDPQSIARDVQISLPGGGTVHLGELADVQLTRGAMTIRTENGLAVDWASRESSG